MAVFSRFLTFFSAFFVVVTHSYGQTKYILQKNRPQMSFPGCREAPNILHSPFEGPPLPTQLTNPSHESQLSRAINYVLVPPGPVLALMTNEEKFTLTSLTHVLH